MVAKKGSVWWKVTDQTRSLPEHRASCETSRTHWVFLGSPRVISREPETAADWISCSLLGLRRPFRVYGGSWLFRACRGLPRGVAVLGVRRPFRRNLAAWHTRAKGHSAQAVKPDVCRCAELEKKHISSTTVSTSLFRCHKR